MELFFLLIAVLIFVLVVVSQVVAALCLRWLTLHPPLPGFGKDALRKSLKASPPPQVVPTGHTHEFPNTPQQVVDGVAVYKCLWCNDVYATSVNEETTAWYRAPAPGPDQARD